MAAAAAASSDGKYDADAFDSDHDDDTPVPPRLPPPRAAAASDDDDAVGVYVDDGDYDSADDTLPPPPVPPPPPSVLPPARPKQRSAQQQQMSERQRSAAATRAALEEVLARGVIRHELLAGVASADAEASLTALANLAPYMSGTFDWADEHAALLLRYALQALTMHAGSTAHWTAVLTVLGALSVLDPLLWRRGTMAAPTVPGDQLLAWEVARNARPISTTAATTGTAAGVSIAPLPVPPLLPSPSPLPTTEAVSLLEAAVWSIAAAASAALPPTDADWPLRPVRGPLALLRSARSGRSMADTVLQALAARTAAPGSAVVEVTSPALQREISVAARARADAMLWLFPTLEATLATLMRSLPDPADGGADLPRSARWVPITSRSAGPSPLAARGVALVAWLRGGRIAALTRLHELVAALTESWTSVRAAAQLSLRSVILPPAAERSCRAALAAARARLAGVALGGSDGAAARAAAAAALAASSTAPTATAPNTTTAGARTDADRRAAAARAGAGAPSMLTRGARPASAALRPAADYVYAHDDERDHRHHRPASATLLARGAAGALSHGALLVRVNQWGAPPVLGGSDPVYPPAPHRDLPPLSPTRRPVSPPRVDSGRRSRSPASPPPPAAATRTAAATPFRGGAAALDAAVEEHVRLFMLARPADTAHPTALDLYHSTVLRAAREEAIAARAARGSGASPSRLPPASPLARPPSAATSQYPPTRLHASSSPTMPPAIIRAATPATGYRPPSAGPHRPPSASSRTLTAPSNIYSALPLPLPLPRADPPDRAGGHGDAQDSTSGAPSIA